MIKMLDDKFAYFYQKKAFGPAVDVRPVSEHTLSKYRGKLPNKLLEYWEAYGFAGYGRGIFWMTDPDEYTDVVEAWLERTRFSDADNYYVIGRSAFGELMLWGTRSGPSITIQCPWGMIFPADKSRWMNEGKQDFLISTWIAGLNHDGLDQTDEAEAPLFERAHKLLGHLAPDEMYGFVPALAMGGPCRISNLQKVKAVEHLMLLAKLAEPEVMRDIVKEIKDQGLWK